MNKAGEFRRARLAKQERTMRENAKKLCLVAACTFLLSTMYASNSAFAKPDGEKPGQTVERSRVKKARRPVEDARQLFAAKKLPANLPASAIGSYANGCIAGANQLPVDGPHWQVMRLSRNRNWGHPSLVDYIEKLSDRAYKDGWNGLLVGDMGMPRGGPMPGGHASHQLGLDVDIWLTPSPDRNLTSEERETTSARSVIKVDSAQLDETVWTQNHAALVRDAAQDPNVARIFVTPAIKQYLCKGKDRHGADSKWLRRLRPYWGHYNHIHVRLLCPKGDRACHNQAPPDPGDGCGKELSDWLRLINRELPNESNPDTPEPKKPVALSSMPKPCRKVLEAAP